jgi:CRP-like cAMP-binding protein
MTGTEIAKALERHPFFKGIPAGFLEKAAPLTESLVFEDGEMLAREGDPADRFFLITRGKVALQVEAPHRPPIVVQTVAEGGLVGWSWLVPPHRWKFSARAIGLTRVLAVSGEGLKELCEEDKETGYEIMKRVGHIMARRLEMTRIQLLDLYGGGK